LLVGGLLITLGVLMRGRWCTLASCGAFGGKEMRNFEDCERMVEELESFFFCALYLWIVAFVSPLELSDYDLLILFSPYS
jgi:hypothetical protein